jgi:LysR family transcriptional regulator, low CO2-responsive transcriptional regulator
VQAHDQEVTLTQLSAFVMVARLGSVKDAAKTLNVSEPAVSQALTALRQHLGDQLITRNGATMQLTTAGVKLLPVASQMVALGAEAQAAVRAGQGLPEQLRLVTTSPIAEFVAGSLTEAFSRRFAQPVEASAGVAAEDEMAVLVVNRLADMALGPLLSDKELVCEPVFRYHMVAVTAPDGALKGAPASWPWLVDPSGIDPSSDVSRMLAKLGVPENQIRVFPNATAAWAAAASGAGVAPGVAHLLASQVRRGELRVVETPATPMEATWYVTTVRRERRPAIVSSMRHFLGTPEAMKLMRSPGSGVPPSKFRPPVYVTIWS